MGPFYWKNMYKKGSTTKLYRFSKNTWVATTAVKWFNQ